MSNVNRVHIELQRVQTWLFAVPRLRAMVGANAMIGETLRIALPELARRQESGWTLAPIHEAFPAADPDDPLSEYDDPAADARDGIISRDGGHFEAQFSGGAVAFADAAADLIRSKLPGIPFRVTIDNEERKIGGVLLPRELPVLAPCEWSGRGLASAIVSQGEDKAYVSLDVEQRHAAASRTRNGLAVDIASLLGGTTKLGKCERATELKALVGERYLAIIHADGNGVGSGAGKGDSERAEFFHRNRVLLRRAVKMAIDSHCPDGGKAPLIPLMLGGDDLLLLSRAEVALPFVVSLCKELESLQQERTGFKLTLGVGVVIAKHTVPIHRLHEVAEQLTGSAKRRFRGFRADRNKRSVVDWAVFSSAWADDPVEARMRDWLRGSGDNLRVLSQRPVDVLGQGLDSLQGLVDGALKLGAAPRSPLRYLIDQLPRGRQLSELAFQELPKGAELPLKDAGVTDLWRSVGKTHITSLLDLVEISEIARLGRTPDPGQGVEEAPNG